jgi:hypothetical protein
MPFGWKTPGRANVGGVLTHIYLLNNGLGQVVLGRVMLDHVRSGRVGLGRVGWVGWSGWVGLGQIRLGLLVGLGRLVGSAWVVLGWVGSCWVGLGRIGSGLLVRLGWLIELGWVGLGRVCWSGWVGWSG